jgi:hypothetical protein
MPISSEEQRRKRLQAIAASRGLPSGSMSSLATVLRSEANRSAPCPAIKAGTAAVTVLL